MISLAVILATSVTANLADPSKIQGVATISAYATGEIAWVDVTEATNLPFRLGLTSGESLCGTGSPSWTYLETSFSNYQATVSTLLSAFYAKKQITVFSNRDANGHCTIAYVRVYS